MKAKKPEMTTVQVRKETGHRLAEYASKQLPRPSIADCVTVAVEQWLNKENAQKES